MADRLGEPKYTGDGIKGTILSPPISSKFLNELEDDDPKSSTDARFLDAIHVYTQFCFYKDHIVGMGIGIASCIGITFPRADRIVQDGPLQATLCRK